MCFNGGSDGHICWDRWSFSANSILGISDKQLNQIHGSALNIDLPWFIMESPNMVRCSHKLDSVGNFDFIDHSLWCISCCWLIFMMYACWHSQALCKWSLLCDSLTCSNSLILSFCLFLHSDAACLFFSRLSNICGSFVSYNIANIMWLILWSHGNMYYYILVYYLCMSHNCNMCTVGVK